MPMLLVVVASSALGSGPLASDVALGGGAGRLPAAPASGHASVSGIVASVSAGSLGLMPDGGGGAMLLIQVGAMTHWGGDLTGIGDVVVGSHIGVEGLWLDGSTIEAWMVSAATGGTSTPITLSGTVLSKGAAEMVLASTQMPGGSVRVRVGAATQWGGVLTGLHDVSIGSVVTVEGEALGDGSVDAWLVSGGEPPGTPIMLVGSVSMIGSSGFVLTVGDGPSGRVSIGLGPRTVWAGSLTGPGDLRLGLEVRVEGETRLNGGVDALLVSGESQPVGQPVSIEGVVTAVGASTLTLTPSGTGLQRTVRMSAATVWAGGLTGPGDLWVGAPVTVDGEGLADGSIDAWMITGQGSVPPSLVYLTGVVISIDAAGFVLAADPPVAGPVRIGVDGATLFGGVLTALSDLLPAVPVSVEGEQEPDGSVHALHVVGHRNGSGSLVQVAGTVASVSGSGFTLQIDGPQAELLALTVSPQTFWGGGLTGLGELLTGLRVEVTGRLTPGVPEMMADGVWLVADSGCCGLHFESQGAVVWLTAPDRFALADGRSYQVDEATEYDERLGSYAGLEVGQFLLVRAMRVGGRRNLALRITFLGSPASGQGLVTITGTVESTDSSELVLDDGTTVLHDDTTVWTGDADQWWSLAAGWQVEISAFRDLERRLVARRVRGSSGRRPTVEGQQYRPREALVLLVDGVNPEAVAARHGAELVGLVNGTAALLRWSHDLSDRLLAVVADDPRVVAVEPNYLFRDPESVRRRYVVVDRTGSEDKLLTQVASSVINLSDLAKESYGSGVIVAVLDTGIDPCHALLADRIVPGGLDLVDDDDDPSEERNLIDDNGDGVVDEAAGHGTFVASVIALVAPEVGILPYRILDDEGSGTAFDLALALAHAIEAGADVINLSLTYQERSRAVDELLEEAAAAGIVVVAAAGNDGSTTVPFPASDSHVLAVTGVDLDGLQLASFANRSSLVRMAAPSVQVYGAVDGSQWGTWDGTSFAAPFVAGTVAAFLSLDHGLDRDLIFQLLEQTGRELDDGAWSGRLLDVESSLTVFGLGTAGSWRGGVSGRRAP